MNFFSFYIFKLSVYFNFFKIISITAASAASIVPTRSQKRGWNNINLSDECGAYVNLFQTHHTQGQVSIIRNIYLIFEYESRFH
jgi:hypothetical protein